MRPARQSAAEPSGRNDAARSAGGGTAGAGGRGATGFSTGRASGRKPQHRASGQPFPPRGAARIDGAGEQCVDWAAAGEAELGVWDYYGRRIAGGERALELGGWEQLRCSLLPDGLRARRGIYFLAARLTWARPASSGSSQPTERLLRTTLGVLPVRAVEVRESSPFGLAAITASADVYPDQYELEAVLALCARAGVHWLRGLGFPIRAAVRAEEGSAARQRWATLRRSGITAHVQCGYEMPHDEEQAAAFRAAFAAALPHYRFCPVISRWATSIISPPAPKTTSVCCCGRSVKLCGRFIPRAA
jgi:hypothetical protein